MEDSTTIWGEKNGFKASPEKLHLYLPPLPAAGGSWNVLVFS